jgi:D-serine deaminase-like pyridoxal phosphate-dependent protein
MKRRHFVAALAAAGCGTAVALKPRDDGAPYDDYFRGLNALLRQHGDGRPRLLLDLDAIDRNIARLMAMRNPRAHYRLVEKSLPCPDLIAYVQAKTGSNRLMSFHLPFLQQDVQRFPDADILLGKPLPANAVHAFYRCGVNSSFEPARQLSWLIDTDARLAQYQQIAQSLRVSMRIVIEIDVGMHRGGVTGTAQLERLLTRIAADREHLQFAGFMGYDAHIGKIPGVIASRATAFRKATDIYQRHIDYVRQRHGQLLHERVIFNGAGSPTFALHRAHTPCNDLAAGSCLVKPSDFDVPTLQSFEAAAFIAAPVLKVLDGTALPGIEALTGLATQWNPNLQRAHFIYGGNWLARPWSPAGIAGNGLWGTSSNQQLLNGSSATALGVDDHLFLRPTQSEAVLLQFGDLWAVRNGELQARWPVLREEA